MAHNNAPKAGPYVGYAIGTTAGRVLPHNPGRSYLSITTDSAIMLGLGAAPTQATQIPVAANGVWEPDFPPDDSVWIAAVTGTANVVVAEG
jgi:hypothetical protein